MRLNRVVVGLALGALAACGTGSPEALEGVAQSREAVGTPPASLVACTNDTACAIPKIAVGLEFTLVARADGTVWASGKNAYGQLGDGTTVTRTVPVQSTGLTSVKAVAAGRYHSVALKEDGTVWAWGVNYYGQLGNGTLSPRTTATQVSAISGVVAIAAGDFHTLALKADGSLWAWGSNSTSQLGDGTSLDRMTPVQITGISGVVAIAAGDTFSIALKSDGTVWTWGRNDSGQLGYGTTNGRSTPGKINALTGVTAVAAGWSFSVALKSDGTVWAWGYNSVGQVGDGTTVLQRNSPVQVVGLSSIVAIASGGGQSFALKSDGTAWGWGSNLDGQLGVGLIVASSTGVPPTQLVGVTNPVAIATGGRHAVAVARDGKVWAWGDSTLGQLGNGETMQRRLPTPIAGLTNIKSLAVKLVHSVAAKQDGSMWGAGSNLSKALTPGFDWTNKHVPIAGVSGALQVAAGISHSVVLKQDGTVWSWGDNAARQLGNGTQVASATPIQAVGLNNVVAVGAGYEFSVALKADGTVWTWGSDAYSALGRGESPQQLLPTQVPGLTGVVAIVAGDYHVAALRSDGTVWGWGGNFQGQVGPPNSTRESSPKQMTAISGAVALAAGQYFTIVLKSDGTVSSPAGVIVGGLSDVVKIAAGQEHALALKTDGTVWAWGRNGNGQLGDGSLVARDSTPAPVSGLSGVTAVFAGANSSFASLNDGSVVGWGDDTYGQLGDLRGSFFMFALPSEALSYAAGCGEVPVCQSGSCVTLTCSSHGACASGSCSCDSGFAGGTCAECAAGYWSFPVCVYCDAAATCSGNGACDSSGTCQCEGGYAGLSCNACATGFGGYPNCVACNAATTCSGHGVCNASGTCDCDVGYSGASCVDSMPPVLTLPANQTVEATSFSGAMVTFTASANDANDGSTPVTCTPASGSTFVIGVTTVNCASRDAANNSASGSFTVTVRDTTAPMVAVPSNLSAEAQNANGAVVTFAVSAVDVVDGPVFVNCVPASGSVFALGVTTVTCAASDAAGNSVAGGFTVTVSDTTSPVLTLPPTQNAEATSSSGAVVTFVAIASDAIDGSVTASCSPASGSTFALGTTTVACTATDAANNSTGGSFTVTVSDSTAPTLSLPANQIVEASSSSGAVVTFATSANDAVDGSATVVCTPASGSTFALGTTTVNCTATDAANNSANGSFTVTVRDTTAPVLTLPSNQTAEATSASGATVTFSASANDVVDGAVIVNCTPASGSTFALGTTTVNCTANDAANNSASGSFTVTVRDMTAPVLALPTNQVVEAVSSSGAVVTFSATASDSIDGAVDVSCSPSTGSTFALGTTTVNCTATDAANNSASDSFTVTVGDTTAPVLTVPANQLVEATSAAGVSVTFTATANDVVSGSSVATCTPASGSMFALGDTMVTCSVSDSAGNSSSGTFTVSVRDTTPPLLSLPSHQSVDATSQAGAVVTFTANANDLIDGVTSVTCVPASGNTFAPGETTVTCTSTDGAGNSTSGNFSVTVSSFDAGVEFDGGAEEDAGSVVDAGEPDDAGVIVDAGVSNDAGVAEDAGAAIDAGAPEDAGVVEDAGVALDAGVPHQDGGTIGTDGGITAPLPNTGCGCTSGGEPLLLVVAMLWLSRRRSTTR